MQNFNNLRDVTGPGEGIKRYVFRKLKDKGGKISSAAEKRGVEPSEEESKRDKMLREAEEILSKAREDSSKLVEDAQIKAQDILKEAEERGLASGRETGLKQGRLKGEEEAKERAGPLFTQLDEIISRLKGLEEDIFKRSEGELINLSLSIAKRVLHKEVLESSNGIIHTLKAAIKDVIGSSELTIKVNPDDLELVKDFKPEILSRLEDVKNINIEGDESITRSGCVIDTDLGEIDARVERMMEEMEREVRKTGAG